MSAWLTEQSLTELQKVVMHVRTFNSEHNCGRPPASARQPDRFVVLTSLRDRTTTASASRTQLRTASNANVGDQTICNRLHERPAVRPWLTQASHAACLVWVRRRLVWTRQQWSRVLFTDESRFTLSFNEGKNWSLKTSRRALP